MHTKWLRIGLILVILLTPFGGAQKSIPALAQDGQPPSQTSTASPATENAAAPSAAPNCTLLDDPVKRSMLSGALETALLHACGREAEPALAAPAATAGTLATTMRPQAVTALGDDVLANDPAGEITSMTQNNAVVAYNEDTGALCSAYSDSYHGIVQGTGFTGFSNSTDGGVTWSDHGALDADSYGYPSLVWRRTDGHFYLATLHSSGLGLWDMGAGCDAATWVGMIYTSISGDKEMLTVDNNPSSPYYGRLYTAWTDFSDGHIYVARSGDAGQIWSAPVDVSNHDQVNGAWLAVDPANGDIYVAWTHWDVYPAGPIDVEMARSTDGGATWGAITNPMSDQVNPRNATATANCGRPALNGDIRYSPYPQIAVDHHSTLHVVYSYDPDGYNTDDVINIYYRRSTDQGATWEPEIQVNDNWNNTDQFSPALAVDETGAIGVFWYDRRLDSANVMIDRYMAVSRDGGQGFEANQRISDESSPVILDASLAPCYHGDYDGAAAGDGTFYTVWGDDRRGDADVWSDSEPYFWGGLTGTVYNVNTLHGLEGAQVETVHSATGIPYGATSDAGGNYALSVPGSETYDVTAQRYGYAPNTVTVTVGADGGHADIPLAPVAYWSITGAVFDANTGYPVHAHVTVNGAPFDPPAPYNETWSDAFTGVYLLPHLAAAIPYTLTFEATGYIPRVYFVGELDVNLTNPDLTLQPDMATCSAPGYEWAEVFYDGFESGILGPAWSTTVLTDGRVVVSTSYPYAGSYSVLLDDSVSGDYSQAALNMTQDFSTLSNVSLDFWWREFDDENHPEDGVFISDDSGASWYPVLSFNDGPDAFRNDHMDIAAAAAANGLLLNDHFRIKFQFYDDYSIPSDGYAIDEVRLETCQLTTGAALSPARLEVEGCPGAPQTHELAFINRSGVSDEVLLTYNASAGATVLDIPVSLGVVSDDTMQPFDVQVQIDKGVSLNAPVYVTITAYMASNPAISDTMVIEKRAALLEQPWEKELDAPVTAFYRGAGATLDDYAYVIGGQNSGVASNRVARYRPGAGWQTLHNKPTAAANIDVAELNGKIYAAGGYDNSAYLTAFEMLDPARPFGSQWTVLTATLPVATSGGAMAAACGNIYLMGGNPGMDMPTHTVYMYNPNDPVAGWTTAAAMPQTQRYAAGVTARGLIFTLGDWDTGTLVQVYDCAANAWLPGYPQLAVGREAPGAAVVHNRYIVVYGGAPAWSFAGQTSVEILDLDDLAAGWQAGPPMNQARMGPGGGIAGGRLIAIGGMDENIIATNTTESIAICPGCTDGVSVAKSGPEWAYTGDVVSYTVVITRPNWLTGTAELADALPAGVDFAGELNASAGTAWYSDTTRTVYWTAPSPASASTTPGTVYETFTNTWATSGLGLAYNPDAGYIRYAHEGSGPHYLHDVIYPIPHSVLHSFNLSEMNPGWPTIQDLRTGVGYDIATGHYFLTDYSGGGAYSDNFVEIDAAGRVINAWETYGAGNDSYDGSALRYIIDIAVAPGSPPRYFATALFDGGLVYELDLHKAGQFVAGTWGKVMTCTVPGITDTAGIDYDAQNGVLYHSDWNSNAVVVTDLACNALATFTCGAATAQNSGVTFIEGQWPPEVWTLDHSNNTTVRCEAVGYESLPEVVTVTFNVTVTAPASTTIANTATLHYRGYGYAAGAPAMDTYYVAGTWADDAIHLLDANLADLGSFPAGAMSPNGMATDGETIWSGHFSLPGVIAYDFTGQELYRWLAEFSSLQGMEWVNGMLAIYLSNTDSIEFRNPRTGALIRAVPGQSDIEGLAFDGTLLWQLSGAWIYGTNPVDGSVVISLTNAASGCPFGGTGITAAAPGTLALACTNGNWLRVSSTDGSVLASGNNGLDMYGLAYVPPQRVDDSAAFHVEPRAAITWTKEIYVNGNYLGRYDEGPFTVVPADDVQLVDRLDYVGREPLFVQLSEDWGSYLVTLVDETHTRGAVVSPDGDWAVTLLPDTTARLVKTLHIADAVPITITEQLSPDGMAMEERAVAFQPPAFVKSGPAVAYNGQFITYTLTFTSQNPLMGPLHLTDTLPSDVEFVGSLIASYGDARYDGADNAIYWTNSPAFETTRRTLNAPATGTTSHAVPAVRGTSALLASASPLLALAPSASWYDAAPLPQGTVRYAHAQCPGDPNRFYVISGVAGSATNKVWRYDAGADVWTELAPIPGPGEGQSAVCYQGRIYVAGGGGINQFYIYDIVRDTWSKGPALSRDVWGAAMGAWDGRIFLAGGDDDFVSGGQTDEVDIYDIAAETWSTDGDTMLAAASAPGWTQVNEYLYVVGGWGDSPANNITATQRYNMASGHWSAGPTFTSGRGDFVLAATGQYLYAIGGDADGGGFFDAVTLTERLDYTDWYGDAWTDIADPLPASLMAYGGGFCTAAKSGGEIWSVGGLTSGWSYANSNQYRPSEPCIAIPASVVITFTAQVTAGAGERVTNTAQMDVHGAILTAASAFDVPLPDWQKQVNGVPWAPGFSVTVADGDMLTVTDVITTPSAFTLRETWDPERLELIGYITPTDGTLIERPWQMAGDAPFAYYRFDAEYSNVTGRVYFLGGRLSNGSTTGRIWEFDPATGVYSDTGVDMPTPISNYNIARLTDNGGDEVLVTFGGRLGAGGVTDVVQGFYPATGATVVFAADPYPTATSPGGVAVVNNIAYVFGGFDAAVVIPDTNIFDITAANGSRWTPGPALNTARSYVGTAVVDGVIYAIGGDSFTSPNLIPLAITEKLDTANPVAWDDAGVADLPVTCDQMRAFGFDTSAPYLLAGSVSVAGCGRHPDEYADGWYYKVTANTWTKAFPDLNQARRNHAGAFIPEGAGTGMPGLWVWGGRQGSDGNLLSAAEFYPLDGGILDWRVPAGATHPLTLTKYFRVESGLWPPTTLDELLGIGAWSEVRPVIIEKALPTFYTLTVATAGTGSGVVTPTIGDYYYLAGASATLTATANPGSVFAGWSGVGGGTNPTVTVMMDDSKTATAVFNLEGVCVDVAGVTLTLVTAGDLYTDTAVQFHAGVSPATAIPYTYTINYGEGASAPAATLDNPLPLGHTFPTTGSRSIVFAAWSCAMATPVSVTLPVTIVEREILMRTLYLPIVMRAYSP